MAGLPNPVRRALSFFRRFVALLAGFSKGVLWELRGLSTGFRRVFGMVWRKVSCPKPETLNPELLELWRRSSSGSGFLHGTERLYRPEACNLKAATARTRTRPKILRFEGRSLNPV